MFVAVLSLSCPLLPPSSFPLHPSIDLVCSAEHLSHISICSMFQLLLLLHVERRHMGRFCCSLMATDRVNMSVSTDDHRHLLQFCSSFIHSLFSAFVPVWCGHSHVSECTAKHLFQLPINK